MPDIHPEPIPGKVIGNHGVLPTMTGLPVTNPTVFDGTTATMLWLVPAPLRRLTFVVVRIQLLGSLVAVGVRVVDGDTVTDGVSVGVAVAGAVVSRR